MGRLTLIGKYSPRFKVEQPIGPAYSDYLNTNSNESWYIFADNKGVWVDGGLYIVANSDGMVVQNELNADALAPDDSTVWCLEDATERLELIEGFEWFILEGVLVSVPIVVNFNKDLALAEANVMIGLYEDLSDVHAEADWRNYRIKAFNWVEGDATPEAPVN